MIPKSVSKGARGLIKSLLEKDKTKRLGAFKDFDEIKNHTYFSDVDWNDVLSKKSPSPLLQYLKKSNIRPKQREQYKKLVRTYGYDKNIQKILHKESLDNHDNSTFIKEWVNKEFN